MFITFYSLYYNCTLSCCTSHFALAVALFLPGIKFTHWPKIRFFAPQGRLVAPIQVKLCRTDGHLGPLGCAKFHLNRHRGWECGRKKCQKFSLFGKESPQGRLPWPISKIFRGFFTPNYPTLVFQIWHDSLHRLRSYCWETGRRSIRPNFYVHPVGKTIRWIEKWMTLFWWARRALSTCKVWGRSCSAFFFVCFFFVCHAPSPDRSAFEGCIVRTSIALPFIVRFWHGL